MKKIWIALFFCFPLTYSTAFGEKCYLVVEKAGNFNPQILITLGTSLISQYFQTVEAIPNSGIGTESCTYKVALTEGGGSIFITITGQGLNAYGDTNQQGMKGLQQAFLRAIFRAKLEKKQEICNAYASVLQEDCAAKSKVNQPRVVNKKEAQPKIVSSVAPVEQEGVRFQVQRCQRVQQKLTCHFTLTSQAKDRNIQIGRYESSSVVYVHENGFRIYDDLGIEYWSSEVKVARKSSEKYVETRLVMDIPVRSHAIFEKFDPEASKVALMQIQPLVDGKRLDVQIRHIPVE